MNIHRSPVMAGTGLLALTLPLSLAAADPPDELHLTGIVRDFHAGHSDMETLPEGGAGLYTGNVSFELGPDHKPIFTGQGAQVINQFVNAQGQPIAPHLFNHQYVCQTGYPEQYCVIVSMESTGSEPLTKFEICLAGDPEFNADGTSTWRYTVEKIQGHDLSHWTLWLPASLQDSIVESATTPGGTWVPFGHPNFPGPGYKWDIDGSIPEVFELVLDGHYFGTNASWAQAKAGENHGQSNEDNSPFFGPSATLSTNGTPWEGSWNLDFNDYGDQSGYFGSPDSGGVESAESFAQWFRDVPGVNMSRPLTITFERQADDVYLFDDAIDEFYSDLGGFFPIDGALFGNTANYGHNYHYTYEIQAQFTYDSQAGQFIEITSTDDVWVFVDGKLAIDMGGVHGSMTQVVDMDRMCLECGEKYRISIFIVDRHTVTHPQLRIRTNTEPESISVPAITAMFD